MKQFVNMWDCGMSSGQYVPIGSCVMARFSYCELRRRERIYKMIHTFGALFGTPKSKNARAFEWIVEHTKFWVPVALLSTAER